MTVEQGQHNKVTTCLESPSAKTSPDANSTKHTNTYKHTKTYKYKQIVLNIHTQYTVLMLLIIKHTIKKSSEIDKKIKYMLKSMLYEQQSWIESKILYA